MKTKRWAAAIVTTAGVSLSGVSMATARAQAPTPAPATREAIEAEFRARLTQVEAEKIARLAALAAGQSGPEAAQTYEDLFRFAISAGLYNEAEPAAERVIRSGETPSGVALLAAMVNIVAEANRGAFDQSLASLSAAIQIREDAAKDPARAEQVGRVLPLPARIALINVYTQKLIQAGRYDIASKALTMIVETTKEPAIKGLAVGRLAQVGLVGKPAPAIAGTDLDGKPVSLDAMKGETILVVFWASWCLPNAQEAGRFGQVAAAYRDKGFRVIGINLDAHPESGVSIDAAMPAVRRFLVDHNVRWPNLINGKDGRDYAKSYGVTELPTNVLIGPDGKVAQIDLHPANLEPTLRTMLAR